MYFGLAFDQQIKLRKAVLLWLEVVPKCLFVGNFNPKFI